MDRGLVGFLRHMLPEAIYEELVIGFHSDCQMRVRVDEAGAQRNVAEIHPVGAGRDSQVGTGCIDQSSLDQDHAASFDPGRFAVEDSRSFESYRHLNMDLGYYFTAASIKITSGLRDKWNVTWFRFTVCFKERKARTKPDVALTGLIGAPTLKWSGPTYESGPTLIRSDCGPSSRL